MICCITVVLSFSFTHPAHLSTLLPALYPSPPPEGGTFSGPRGLGTVKGVRTRPDAPHRFGGANTLPAVHGYGTLVGSFSLAVSCGMPGSYCTSALSGWLRTLTKPPPLGPFRATK